MSENYRGYELNQKDDPAWADRENALHKQLIDEVLDSRVPEAPNDGTSYNRKNGTWVDSSIPLYDNNRYVSPNGNDTTGTGTTEKPFKTITHTLSTITDATLAKPYAVILAAGIYPETQVVCKEFVTIASMSPTSVVTAADPDTDLFLVANNSPLIGFNIIGPANAKAVVASVTDAVTIFKQMTMIDSYDGIYINGTNTNITITNLYITTTSPTAEFNNVIEIAEGSCDIQGVNVRTGTKANTLIKVSGVNSGGHMWTVDNDSTDVLRYIDIQDGALLTINNSRTTGGNTAVYLQNATLSINGLSMSGQDIGIDVGPIGFSTLICNSVTINSSITYDIRTQTQTMILAGLGNLIADSKIEFVNGPPSIAHAFTHFSDDEGDTGLRVKAELGVGAPDSPYETALGEGDSYTRGIAVYTEDPTNGFIDITPEAKSYSGSGFEWPDVNDSSIYAASTLKDPSGDFVKYFGFKVAIATPGVNGTGQVITEYWNGTTWTPFTIMRTEGDAPYYPRTETLIEAPAGSYQIRHNAAVDVDWTKNDPMGLGTDYYWTRVRIVSPITTSPVFEQFKLHSNRTEFNGDGWVEYFGKARPIGRLPWTYGMLEAAAASPGNSDNYLSQNLDVGKVENKFEDNKLDRIGLLSPIPFDMDTSTPIKMRWAVRHSNNSGSINWIVRWGYSVEGDVIHISQGAAPAIHPTEQSIEFTTNVPSTTGELVWHSVNLEIFNMNPRHPDGISDILWVSIERDGTSDTSSGDSSMVALSADYMKWTEGGHL